MAYTKVPIFWSSIGKGLRYLGTGAGYDDMFVDGNFKELKVCNVPFSEDWLS